jgi:hypothetical protein
MSTLSAAIAVTVEVEVKLPVWFSAQTRPNNAQGPGLPGPAVT